MRCSPARKSRGVVSYGPVIFGLIWWYIITGITPSSLARTCAGSTGARFPTGALVAGRVDEVGAAVASEVGCGLGESVGRLESLLDGGSETGGVDGSAGGNTPNGNGSRWVPGSLREQAASPTVAAATMTARRLTARSLAPSAIVRSPRLQRQDGPAKSG